MSKDVIFNVYEIDSASGQFSKSPTAKVAVNFENEETIKQSLQGNLIYAGIISPSEDISLDPFPREGTTQFAIYEASSKYGRTIAQLRITDKKSGNFYAVRPTNWQNIETFSSYSVGQGLLGVPVTATYEPFEYVAPRSIRLEPPNELVTETDPWSAPRIVLPELEEADSDGSENDEIDDEDFEDDEDQEEDSP